MNMASASSPVRVPAAVDKDDHEASLTRVRAMVKAGDEQWERGETLDGDEVFDELIRTFHQRHPHATE